MKRLAAIALCLVAGGAPRARGDDAPAPAPAPAVANVRDRGAKGDDAADDTAAIQAALDVFSAKDACGVVEIPVGTYRVSRTLVYRGNSSYGIRIRGTVSSAGLVGSALRWTGPDGGAVLRLSGVTGTAVEHLSIDGRGKAGAGIAVGFDGQRGQGTSNVTLSHLSIGGVAGDASAAVLLGFAPDGTPDNRQCDAILVERCSLTGYDRPGTAAYGIRTATANCKNFAVRDTSCVGFRVGIAHGGSGFLIVDGFAGGNNIVADVQGSSGNVELRAGNSENSARLFVGTTGANAGSLTVSNWSWDGKAPPDDVVVDYQGAISLSGCHLWNRRTATSVPKVRLNAGNGAAASLDSRGNYYAGAGAGGTLPAVGGDGAPIIPAPGYLAAYPPLIRSFGDYGGREGNLAYLRPLP